MDISLKININKSNLLIASCLICIWFILGPSLSRLFQFEINKKNLGLFYCLFTVIFHEMIWVLFNLFFIILYKLEVPFIEKYKAQKIKWPWADSDTTSWNELIISTIKVMFLNHFIVIPILLFPNYILNKCPYRLTNDFPTHFEFFYQTTFFIICEDFFFYWTHRFFHIKSIYPLFHKIHHKYQNTISVSAEFTHPVEFLIGNLFPSAIGPLILGSRVHIGTYALWLVLRIWKTTEAHSGYDFPITPFGCLPFTGSSRFHNYHHLHFKGNYGSFFIFWDYLCGTINKRYISIIENELPINPYEEKIKKIN